MNKCECCGDLIDESKTINDGVYCKECEDDIDAFLEE